MANIHIVLNVSPVGVWMALASADAVWFAVQISAVTDAEPADADRAAVANALLPWSLLRGNGWVPHKPDETVGSLALACWIADPANINAAPMDLASEPPHANTFAAGLADLVASAYAVPGALDDLLLADAPGVANPNEPPAPDKTIKGLFGAAIHGLATLPGPVSAVFGSTIYVRIPRNQLNNLGAQSRLVIVPKLLYNNTVDATTPKNLAPIGGVYANYGDPGGGLGVYRFNYGDGSIQLSTPGFPLSLFTSPPSSIFPLDTYWLPVSATAQPAIDIDAAITGAVDPFVELHDKATVDTVAHLTLQTAGGSRTLFSVESKILRARWTIAEAVAALGETAFTQFCFEFFLMEDTTPENAASDARAAWAGLQRPPPVSGTPFEKARWLAKSLGLPDNAAVPAIAAAATPRSLQSIALALLRRQENLTETTRADQAWRRSRSKISPESDVRAKAATLGVQLPLAAMRVEATRIIRARWESRLAAKDWDAGDLPTGASLVDTTHAIDKMITDRVGQLGSSGEIVVDKRPSTLPEAGLSIFYGQTDQTVVHADDYRYGSFDVFRHFSGVLLWMQRSSIVEATVGTYSEVTDKWRLQTAGLLKCGGDSSAPYPVPSRIGFDRDLHRAELRFEGHPLTAEHPLADAYDAIRNPNDTAEQQLLSTTAAGPDAPFGIIPLRYGDWYRSAVSMMDEAGGYASEVASAGKPFELAVDSAALDVFFNSNSLAAKQRYLRSVAVGDVNVDYAGDDSRRWPNIPTDVKLRADEQWSAWYKTYASRFDKASPVATPKLLLRNTDAKGVKPTASATMHHVRLMPPSIDEHTLLRWAAPVVGSATAEAEKAALREALIRILTVRSEGKDDAAGQALAHDPSVYAIGLSIFLNGDAKIAATALLPLSNSAKGAFLRNELVLTVQSQGADPLSLSPQFDASGTCRGAVVNVPEGQFVYIMVQSLVPSALVPVAGDPGGPQARFSPQEYVDSAIYPGYAAFAAVPILVECISPTLPTSAVLHDASSLQVNTANGAVALLMDAGLLGASLPYLDSVTLERETLAWRNLPWVSKAVLQLVPDDEKDRVLSGALPSILSDESKPGYAEMIGSLEPILAVDGGLVRKPRLQASWPRDDRGRVDCSGPLVIDSHDGDPRALYCRYSVTAPSRYAPLLQQPAVSFAADAFRRAVIPYRGRTPKPPIVLAVIPLTQTPAAMPGIGDVSMPRATPLLVLLDECWFKDYGPGERLIARIEREPNDPGEDFVVLPDGSWVRRENPRPYRLGPLPDHFKAAVVDTPAERESRYLLGRVTADEDERNPQFLRAYGPFGYSFDESADQALASASAFLLIPHAAARPHFHVSVRFQRRLDFPSGGDDSDFGAPHSAYFAPDGRFLLDVRDPVAKLQIASDYGSARLAGYVASWLDPLSGSSNPSITSPWHKEKKDAENRLMNSDSGANYRYFLFFTDFVDNGGQAELPVAIARIGLFTAQNIVDLYSPFYRVQFGEGDSWKLWPVGSSPRKARRARVLEVWLNGRHDSGVSPFDEPQNMTSMTDFWQSLLPKNSDKPLQEPWGQLRRVSPPIDVEMQ